MGRREIKGSTGVATRIRCWRGGDKAGTERDAVTPWQDKWQDEAQPETSVQQKSSDACHAPRALASSPTNVLVFSAL